MLVFGPDVKTTACDLCLGSGVLYLNAMIKSSQTILAISQTRSHVQRGRARRENGLNASLEYLT